MTSKNRKKPRKPFDTAQFERNLREDCARNEANIRAMFRITPPVSAMTPPGVQLLFKFD